MQKVVKPLAKPSISSYLFCLVFGVGGVMTIAFGLDKILNNDEQATSQFVLSLVLGSGFLAISGFLIWSLLYDRKKFDWLNREGVWILAKPIEARTLMSDSFGKVTSLQLILKANEDDAAKHGLADVQFESEPINIWGLVEDYQQKEFDVVFDPNFPEKTYFVNVELKKLMGSQSS